VSVKKSVKKWWEKEAVTFIGSPLMDFVAGEPTARRPR
jgi:hypothetical protein